MFEVRREQIDEYETDSDEGESDFKEIKIQSFSTEPALHDPAELFVHLCVSTCYSKR